VKTMNSNSNPFYDYSQSKDFLDVLRLCQESFPERKKLDWIISNDVPLFALSDDALSEMTEPDEWIRLKKNYQKKIPLEKWTWLEEYYRIFNKLSANDIPACLIKTYGPFPFWSGNVDVIVPEEKFKAALAILSENGFIRIPWLDEPNKVLLKKFSGGKVVISLHLHCRISWHNTYLRYEDIIRDASNIQISNGLLTLQGGALVATTIAHSFFENCKIRAIDLLILRHSLNSPEILENARKIASSEGWEREFIIGIKTFLIADRNHWLHTIEKNCPEISSFKSERYFLDRINTNYHDLPLNIPFLVSKGALISHALRHRDDSLLPRPFKNNIFSLIMRYILRNIHGNSPKGLIIAISGPDGAGKTTIRNELLRMLKEFGISAKPYWSRYGSPSIKLKKHFDMQIQSGKTSPSVLRTKIGKSILCNVKFFDISFRLWLRSICARLSGTNLIFDRYLIDAEVDHMIDLMKIEDSIIKRHLFHKVANSLILKPNFHILLRCDAKILSNRTKEDIKRCELQDIIYKKLSNENIQIILETENDLQNTLDYILSITLRELKSSYEKNRYRF